MSDTSDHLDIAEAALKSADDELNQGEVGIATALCCVAIANAIIALVEQIDKLAESVGILKVESEMPIPTPSENEVLVRCPICHGRGEIHSFPVVNPGFTEKCWTCNGRGQVTKAEWEKATR